MGGIIGKLSFERDETLAHPVLEQMLDAVRHRGGDSRGIHTAPGVALGWRGDADSPRQNAFGQSVASNEQRTVLVVADAAITNAADLRAELARAGHPVDKSSDTTLLAHAYVQWGDGCVDHLRGAFAFAVWDTQARRLLLARDASGVRPLYYALLPGHGIVFASTIRALLTDPGVGREWCPVALDGYLAHGYVPGTLTPYQRISKLAPGQRLIVEGRRFVLERAAAVTVVEADLQVRPATPAEVLEREIRRVVAEHPREAGILFSGGPASTALVAAADRRATVIIGLEQDTRQLARAHARAQALGADVVVDIATPEIASIAADVAAIADEPQADAALVAHYAVCLTAQQHLDVALSGHGGMMLWSERRLEPSVWNDAERLGIYTRRFADQVLESSIPEPAHTSELLVMADRLALDAGIRLYFPLTDPRLAERAAAFRSTEGNLLRTLAHRSGLRGCESSTSRQHRRVLHPWLPAAVRTMVPALLLSERFDGRGMVSRAALHNLWEDHRLGRRDHSQRFWSLLMLELWFREFIDGGAIDAPLEYAFARAA